MEQQATNEMTLLIILLVGIVVVAVMLIILIVKHNAMAKNLDVDIDQDIDEIAQSIANITGQLDADRKTNAEFNTLLRSSMETNLREGMQTQHTTLQNASEKQMEKLQEMTERQETQLGRLMRENQEQRESMMELMSKSLKELQDSNERRLEKIQGVVNEKLDKTLNERLDTNFKQVGEQLGNLYKSLGELKDLSSGVQDLNKTLTNVKTRGTWGEVQLDRILEQTLAQNQYQKNVATKKNSNDRVEFAVRMPGIDPDEPVFMPIDAKFPSDIYNTIVDASADGDVDALNKATGLLKQRILDNARTIRDKYIDPPRTTQYGLMFLPTEGLYAEVLRVDGLTEQCQQIGVIVTGPTTITAVLNSLRAGFTTLQLSKKSVEVMKLLEAIKAQFGRMDEEVKKTQKKLSEATQATDQLQKRTDLIQRRMRNIGEIDVAEADAVLQIEADKDLLTD